MVPNYVKHLTVSKNEDSTYNIVYITDMIDGDTVYENCEVILPRVVKLNNDMIIFPYYDEEETLVTITIPGDI